MENVTSTALVSNRNRFSVKFIGLLLLFVGVSVEGWGQNSNATFTKSTSGSAWWTNTNWSTSLWAGIKATSTSNTNIATFTSASAPIIGINMGTSSLCLGAISIDNTRTSSIDIGNSSGTTSGTMALYGTVVNSVDNVIIRNNGTGLFTLQASQSSTMGVVLSNSTENIINIDGTGGVTISSIISGSSKNLTKAGSGSGVLTLSGVNTYSGNTTISTGTLALSGSGSIANSPIITIASGGTFSISGRTNALTLGSGQSLKSSATGSNTTATLTVASSKDLTLSTGGIAFTAYGGGATAPLTVTGATAGALALNSAPITVTTTTALTAGTYTLIAKSGSATGVSGTPGTLSVNGSGLAANTSGSLSVSSGQLILTVVSVTTPSFSISGTTSHGSMCLNTAATKQTYTITNSGTAATNVVVSSSDPQFVVSNLSSTSISGSGGTATYDVTFTPTSTGAKTSTITVYYDTNTSAATSSLTGTGVNTAPTVTASAATGIGLYTATIPGTISNTGCTSISAYGIEYSTSNGFADGAGTQVSGSNLSGSNYSVALSGLNLGTTYYYKTYATNSGGTSYSTQSSFMTSTPTITVNTVTAFGNQTVNTISTEKSFILSGSNLIADVSIAPPSGFEISTGTGGSFVATNPIVLSPTSGTLASTTIYVRFAPALLQAYSGSIDITSTSATTKTVVLSGTGTAAADPTGVSATAASSVQINVAFTKNANNNNVIIAWNTSSTFGTPANGTAYNVSDVLSGGGTILYKGATSPFNHSSLSPNTTYYYKVWSYDGVNYYSAGVAVNATTNGLSTVNATAGTDLSSAGFIAHWDAVTGAENYKLDVATTSNFGYSSKLSENFSGFTTNNGSTDRSASLNTYLQTTGWTGDAVYEMVGYTKMGAGSTKGVLTTPTIDLSANSGNATLTFDLMKYGSDATLVQVFHATDGSTFNQVGTDITAPASLTTQTISITGGTVNSKIRIAAKIASNYRYYLDNFSLTQENPTVLLSNYNNLTVPGTTQSVTNLSPNTTYYYRVRATSANSTSTNSNVISVTTLASYNISASSNDELKGSVSGGGAKDAGASVSLSATPASESYRFVNWIDGSGNFVSKENPYSFTASANKTLVANFADISSPISISTTTNASIFTACATCDVNVASGGSLTIDETKTFNSVSVATGGKLTLNNGVTLNPGTITLVSSGSGTATFVDERSNATVTPIAATVEQYLPQGRNWYVGIPVANAGETITASSLTGAGASSVTYWDETAGAWVNDYTGPLTPGRGYIAVSTSGTGTNNASFSGNLNTGDFPVTVTRTVTAATKPGFNLIANPYPSYLNPCALITGKSATIEPTIWYRTKSGSYKFETVNTADGVGTGGVTGYIPPMQAFWVRVKPNANPTQNNSETLTFTNTMRYHANPSGVTTTVLKAPGQVQKKLVRLQVSNGLNTDEAVIYTSENALDGFDVYDSRKMSNDNVKIPEIYTLAGTEQLVINGMNSLPLNTEMPLGFVTGESNTFSLSATEISNLPSDIRVVLKDGSSEYDLTDGGTYSFSSPVTSTSSRFSVIFKSAGAVTGVQNPAIDDKNLLVYCNANKHIVVESNAAAVVSVFNAVGQKLFTQNLTSDKTELNRTFTPGVYMVVVNGVNRKVVVE